MRKFALDSQKVRMIAVFYKKQFQTDGSTSWTYIDLEIPGVESWGPYLESIIAYTNSENLTNLFQWKLVSYWSMDGRVWSNPSDVFSGITSSGQAVQTAFSTASALGPIMRYAVAVSNESGTAIERGVLSLALAFNFKS